jgi:7,8-dihydropterin-6-yl-methyl-4-(beta-D-ribofuranosyl)aminobenzene 5'-phosphate synthase
MPPTRLTILFDNEPGVDGLERLWGFAALIETGARRILFDTGSNGRVLLRNMAALGCRVESVDMLLLSHPHWDHMGGLDSVLELNANLTLVLHQGFSKHLLADLRAQCRELVVVGPQAQQLAPGLFSTGTLDSEPPEHGLVLDLGGVSAAISGCAHPGMARIVERGATLLGRPIDWAIGGFHLMYADADEIERSIQALQALDVAYVVPTHCTGDAARAAFEQAYGAHCVAGGVGREILLWPRPGGERRVFSSDTSR